MLFELCEQEPDDELSSELETRVTGFVSGIEELEMTAMLSGPYDTHAAIFSLYSGAGGVDAMDWTELLVRMYTRWFESKQFKVDVVETSYGDEAGIKSATMIVTGDFAYGYLKEEAGVHRLVRLSPFNANNKRQTSFAAVDVVPQLTADTELDIDPKDLKMDTFRASGAGGQHVNKTDSAVRITHLPTKIVAQSQNSRSQIENRQMAMTILKSRLIKLKESQHLDHVDSLRGESMENAWGSQIRSYIFHPYSMVKDHRTNYETSDVKAVMDGQLDAFVRQSLSQKEDA